MGTAIAAVSVAAIAGGVAYLAATRFRTARAHEMLVRTGLNVPTLELGRAFFAWVRQLTSFEERKRRGGAGVGAGAPLTKEERTNLP